MISFSHEFGINTLNKSGILLVPLCLFIKSFGSVLRTKFFNSVCCISEIFVCSGDNPEKKSVNNMSNGQFFVFLNKFV